LQIFNWGTSASADRLKTALIIEARSCDFNNKAEIIIDYNLQVGLVWTGLSDDNRLWQSCQWLFVLDESTGRVAPDHGEQSSTID
tara:strand:- start:326 stop:580 length:255 start_codon:yes stop_codon:yes gene_type:complete